MATRTISDSGGNWTSAGTWVEGVAPTWQDDVVATGTSGNLTIDTNYPSCKSLDLSLYTGTFTGSSGRKLTITNSLLLGTSMTNSFAGNIYMVDGVGTISGSGKQIIYLNIGVDATGWYRSLGKYTLGTDLIVNNLLIGDGGFDTANRFITYHNLTISGQSTLTCEFRKSLITNQVLGGGHLYTDIYGQLAPNFATFKLKLPYYSGTSLLAYFKSDSSIYNLIVSPANSSQRGIMYLNPETTAAMSIHSFIQKPNTSIHFSEPTPTTYTFDLFEAVGNATQPLVWSGLDSVFLKSSGIVKCDYVYFDSIPAGGGATWYTGSNSDTFVIPPLSGWQVNVDAPAFHNRTKCPFPITFSDSIA